MTPRRTNGSAIGAATAAARACDRAGAARVAARGEAPPRRAARGGGAADPAVASRPLAGVEAAARAGTRCRVPGERAGYEAYRARGVMKDGRRFGRRRTRTRRPPRRRGRSTSPIRTRATSRRHAVGFRATTPRLSATSARSSSPRRSTSTRPTSVTSNRWLRRPSANSKPRASGSDRRWCSPTPATGTTTRLTTSLGAARRC